MPDNFTSSEHELLQEFLKEPKDRNQQRVSELLVENIGNTSFTR